MIKKILFVPDVHIPYHDQKAWQLMIMAGRYFEPHIIVVLGDFGDFYSVSSFSKDPRRVNQLDAELYECVTKIGELDGLQAERKIFIAGNHEERLERYLKDKAPALYSSVKVEKLLELEDRGWEFVPYRKDIKIGALYITHDVDVMARNAVYKTLDVYQHSVITGHSHRLAYIVESNAVGTELLSAQFGWLGDVEEIDYKHRIRAVKDWALGFGIGYWNEKSGLVFVQPVPIVRYQCLIEGKIISLKEGKSVKQN